MKERKEDREIMTRMRMNSGIKKERCHTEGEKQEKKGIEVSTVYVTITREPGVFSGTASPLSSLPLPCSLGSSFSGQI